MVSAAQLSVEHLELRLAPLRRALQCAIERQARANARQKSTPQASVRAISHEVVTARLERLRRGFDPLDTALTPEQESHQQRLRAQAQRLGEPLPLDHLQRICELDAFEVETLLWCVLAETSTAYASLFAFAQDDWSLTSPSIGFLAECTATDTYQYSVFRYRLSPNGTLRRLGLLRPASAGKDDGQTELRQRLLPGDSVLSYLTGAIPAQTCPFRDRESVTIPEQILLPPGFSGEQAISIAQAFRNGRLRTYAVWGAPGSFREEAVYAISQAAGKKLRQPGPDAWNSPSTQDAPRAIKEAGEIAASLDAFLWLDLDRFNAAFELNTATWLGPALAACPARLLLTGSRPWRPLEVSGSGAYAETELLELETEQRRRQWQQLLPGAAPADQFPERLRISSPELRAIAHIAETTAAIRREPENKPATIRAAASIVTRKGSAQLASIVTPRRGPEDLILPEKLDRQVLEIAEFFLASHQVYENWGFAHRVTGGGGVKALFCGDPGTGKTLAAEVIAHQVGLPLMKVELAGLVSKWIGETEKNLDRMFREAEQSHAVLFIDECDALTGRRGEIRQGSDRFASMQTVQMLQKLEQYGGLAILATNAREQMDEAFQRRFQVVLHFPVPTHAERLRIWRIAFPTQAPLEPGVHLAPLAKLEMTGASIVSAACNAAMLAANEASPLITMDHIMRGLERQFQRENRMFSPTMIPVTAGVGMRNGNA